MFYDKEIPGLIWILVTWAVIFFVSTLSRKERKYPKFEQYGTIVVFLLSVITLVWLSLHKELFHWHYDIATGEPVDHYSTYGTCVVRAIISCAISILNILLRIFRKQGKRQHA